MSKLRGDALGAVDDDRRHRNLPAELNQLVAVRFMVAVEAPDAAQHRRAAGGAATPTARRTSARWIGTPSWRVASEV